MNIPARLADRPRFRGFPVPFVTYVGEGGTPDFKIHDRGVRDRLVEERLCQLCGGALDPTVAFLMFPEQFGRMRTGEPPMHPECADFALTVCPFLAHAQGYASTRREGITYVDPVPVPREVVLALVTTYTARRDGLAWVYLVGPPTQPVTRHDRYGDTQ